jgi:hypothetical protein
MWQHFTDNVIALLTDAQKFGLWSHSLTNIGLRMAAFEKFVITKQFFVLQALMRYDYVGFHTQMDHEATIPLFTRSMESNW